MSNKRQGKARLEPGAQVVIGADEQAGQTLKTFDAKVIVEKLTLSTSQWAGSIAALNLKRVETLLKSLGVNYVRGTTPEAPDFILPEKRVAIEVWTTARMQDECQARVNRFYKQNYRVLFITRHDLTARDSEDRLRRAIKGAMR